MRVWRNFIQNLLVRAYMYYMVKPFVAPRADHKKLDRTTVEIRVYQVLTEFVVVLSVC